MRSLPAPRPQCRRFAACVVAALCTTGDAMAVDKLSVLGLFKDRAIVSIDGTQRVLRPGQQSPEGVMLVSANANEAVIVVDGEQRTLTLGQHIGASFAPPAAGKSVVIAPDAGGMYEVAGSINGFQVNFMVDTGATLISMNRNVAKRLGIDYRLTGRESVSQTAAGLARIFLVRLEEVRVGDIALRDVQGAVHDADDPPMILLGNSFLNRVDLERRGELLELHEKRL
jgi:aspartyl protease family protein